MTSLSKKELSENLKLFLTLFVFYQVIDSINFIKIYLEFLTKEMEKGLVTTGNYKNILTNLIRIYVTCPHVKQGFVCSSLQRNVLIHEAHLTFQFFCEK